MLSTCLVKTVFIHLSLEFTTEIGQDVINEANHTSHRKDYVLSFNSIDLIHIAQQLPETIHKHKPHHVDGKNNTRLQS